MKRIIFIMLMTICSQSWAGWEVAAPAKDDSFISYYDKSTIKKKGVIVKMWTMKELSEVQTAADGGSYLSITALKAYNCESEETAVISVTLHSGSMGSGKITGSELYKEKEWDWEPIPPYSVWRAEWKIACGKR